MDIWDKFISKHERHKYRYAEMEGPHGGGGGDRSEFWLGFVIAGAMILLVVAAVMILGMR